MLNKMGGKNLKFPARKKYVAPINDKEIESKPVSDEEHQKRIKMLQELGVLK
jgi:hypothetical protein